MNNEIFYFKPKAALIAEENLTDFINACKSKLTIFGKDCWNENKWETYHGIRRVVARFSTNMKHSTSYSYTPLEAPFIDFAKAYILYTYSFNPVTNLHRHFEAIRVLEEALITSKGRADILLLDGLVLEQLDDVFKMRLSDPSGRNKAGYQMELLLNFCRETLITPSLPQWSNPYQKVNDLTIKLDEHGKEHRSNKLPSDDDMMLVAELFHNAPSLSIEAEYYSSIMALLMVAPSRCSELFSLSTDCLVWEEDRSGDKKLGIRWVPAKGGKAGIKWVPTIMHDIVIEAISRLNRIGEPARIAARFAEDNPTKFMIHKQCSTPNGFSESEALSLDQLNSALSLNLTIGSMNNLKWLSTLMNEGSGKVCYRLLGKYEYAKYTKKFKNWPYIDKAKNIKTSEALLLHRENEFHAVFQPREYSFCLPTVNNINDRFSCRDSKEGYSIWNKFNILRKDGSYPQITTHNARHWLSTMAERGGMGEVTLANWAGRAKISDNASYDHRTAEEKADAIANILIPKNTTILEKIERNLPVSFADIGKDLPGSAIITEFGICEHDFAMTPCQRYGDCEICTQSVCIKGYNQSLESLKTREKQVTELYKKSLTGHEVGAFGADQWVSKHAYRLSIIKTKIKLLEDERVVDGALIRIPDVFDPSPAMQVLMRKGLDIEIQSSESIGVLNTVNNLLER